MTLTASDIFKRNQNYRESNLNYYTQILLENINQLHILLRRIFLSIELSSAHIFRPIQKSTILDLYVRMITFIYLLNMQYQRNNSDSSTKKPKRLQSLPSIDFDLRKRMQSSRIQSFKSLVLNQIQPNTQLQKRNSKCNQILKLSHKEKGVSKHYFLIPYYMRLKIKDVNQILYKESTAIMNGSLIINIETTGLPERFVKKIKSRLVLQINRCQQLKIKKSNEIQIGDVHQIIDRQKKSQIKITIRKQFKVAISKQYSKIFLSPFEELFVIASFTLNSISFYKDSIKICFNSMDFMKIDYEQKGIKQKIQDDKHLISKILKEIQEQEFTTEDWKTKQDEIKGRIEQRKRLFINRFLQNEQDKQSLQIYFKAVRLQLEKDVTSGDYQISKKLFGIDDSCDKFLGQTSKNDKSKNEDNGLTKEVQKFRGKKDEKDLKFKQFKKFEHTHFYFTLYRNPFPRIFTILIPNIFLGALSLIVFIFKLSLIERTSIIATLLLGFIQLLPSMKEQTIDDSSLSLVEIITYIYTFVCFVSLFDSLHLHENLLQNVNYYEQIDLNTKLEKGFKISQLLPENWFFVFCLAVNVLMFIVIFSSIFVFKLYEKRSLLEPQNYKNRKSKSMQLIDRLMIFTMINKVFNSLISLFSGGKKDTQLKTTGNKQYPTYSDYEILAKFLKMPDKHSLKWSLYWNNDQCDKQLENYNNKNPNQYEPIDKYDLSPLA